MGYNVLLEPAMGRCLVVFCALAFAAPALPAADLEADARRIESRLMAPCCGMNALTDHYSGAAEEMKREIRRMLAAGRTEPEILDFYVARYGDAILAAPPARGFGLLAYLLPAVLVLLALTLTVGALRVWRRGAPSGEGSLPPPEIDPRDALRVEEELKKFG